jgi:archaellum biogenesis ATPase FlaH
MTAADTPRLPSGIDAVDARWGGLWPGSAVLLVGRGGAGRTALALRAIRAAVESGTTALLLSPKSPDHLTTAARASGFDLAEMHRSGHLRVLRIPSAADLAAKGNAGMNAAYRDLAGLAARAAASRVVIEDFTPLVQFSSFEAFAQALDGLRESLAAHGASFLLGLGEPANDPSRQLLSVVGDRVDGLVRVSTDGAVTFSPSHDESSGASAPSSAAPASAPEAPPPAEPPPAEPAPAEPAQPPAPEPVPPSAEIRAPEAPAPEPPTPEEPAAAPEVSAPEAPVAEPSAPEPSAPEEPIPVAEWRTPTAERAPAPPETEAAPSADRAPAPPPETEAAPAAEPLAEPTDVDPFLTMPLPGAESNDGASLDVNAPSQSGFDLEAAPEAPGAPSSAPAPASADGIPAAGVEPASPPDPDLLSASPDRFSRDPGQAFFDSGYLIDSRDTAPPPAPSDDAPFASGAPAPPPDDKGESATKAALEAAFANRATGVPFLVVAARMEPAQPEATYFNAVAEGLRAAMPHGSTFYVDDARLRSLLVVPGATAEASTQIFAGLQQHLLSVLGAQADPTLRAVAAITVPNGDPFGTAEELWNYAVEG